MNKLAPFFLAAALALPGLAFADAPSSDAGASAEGPRAHRHGGRHARHARAMAQLDLSQEQRQALREARRSLRAEARAVRGLPAGSAARIQAQADLHTRRVAMMDAVLTPSQREARDAARAGRAASREGRMPRDTGARLPRGR